MEQQNFEPQVRSVCEQLIRLEEGENAYIMIMHRRDPQRRTLNCLRSPVSTNALTPLAISTQTPQNFTHKHHHDHRVGVQYPPSIQALETWEMAVMVALGHLLHRTPMYLILLHMLQEYVLED